RIFVHASDNAQNWRLKQEPPPQPVSAEPPPTQATIIAEGSNLVTPAPEDAKTLPETTTKKRGRQATPSDEPEIRKRRRSVGTSTSQHPEGQARPAKESQRSEESRGKQAASEGALATSSSITLEEVVPDSQGEEEVRPTAIFLESRPIPEDVYYDFMGSLDDLMESQMSQLGPTQLDRLEEHKCDKTEISSGLGQLRTLEGQ
ncbi:hypothetical protein BC834DRAFT_842163, partial [Gloeopeniophorella convolvens]